MEYSDQQLINRIREGDLASFETLYKKYYTYLCLIAEHIVRNPSDVEEIVSDVFIKLWNLRENIDIRTSIKSYLIKAVHNTSLNYLERNRLINKHADSLDDNDYKLLIWDSDYPLGQLYKKEILDILENSVNTLPDACRQIFILSRNENMKYSDIAGKLGISVNTVKTQIKIALARLRATLKDYASV